MSISEYKRKRLTNDRSTFNEQLDELGLIHMDGREVKKVTVFQMEEL